VARLAWHPGAGQAQDNGAWWKHATIYQVYPSSFQDSDGDGHGDLPGVLSRIDHLGWLGVDTLWLGPVFASPMADHGYDVTGFTEVDRVFGSMSDFDALVHALHARSMKLVLDFIPNHTSDRHPWFAESRSSRDNPKRDWYVWADPAPGGGPPNNWLSRFGGTAWKWDEHTGQYYYHAFLEEQPDLNWRNPEVRSAMADVLRFWMHRGVDGFRIDAAAVLAEDALLRDDPPNPKAREQDLPPPERNERVNTNYRPEVLDWLAELRAVVDEFPARVLLGEVDTVGERIAHFYGKPDRLMLHLPLNYALLDSGWQAGALKKTIEGYLKLLPPHAWPDWIMGSHDKKRIADRIGDEQLRIAAMLLFTLPGTPIMYAGDEIGMLGARVAHDESLDPFEHLVPGYGLNRDPERSPMQWDAGPQAGFSRAMPWIRLAPQHERRNVDVQREDEGSLLSLYRRLIGLRKAHPVLRDGGLEHAFARGELLGFQRRLGPQRLQVLLNLGDDTCERGLPEESEGLVLSTDPQRQAAHASGTIRLQPHEGVVLALTTP
jgi:alpha-glucosidase